MVAIVVAVIIYLAMTGYSYYQLPLEERFYHPRHHWFKPSGWYGHGLGIVGTLLIMFGVFFYIARKRYGLLERFIRLKYLLEFHIFLCVLGPVMILFHTAFKFGGIVSVAFWSMVAVVASGVIGRFIYIQIPRTIEGRELSLQEVQAMKTSATEDIQEGSESWRPLREKLLSQADQYNETHRSRCLISKLWADRRHLAQIRSALRAEAVPRAEARRFVRAIRQELSLSNKIQRLQTMQQLFKYWHVAHLPFALIMLIIVIIHVAITLALGYKWIF